MGQTLHTIFHVLPKFLSSTAFLETFHNFSCIGK